MVNKRNSITSDRITYQLVRQLSSTEKSVKGRTYNDAVQEEDRGPTIGKRHIEVFNFFSLHLIAQLSRMHLPITIVAMTDPTASSNPDIPTFDWKNRNVILSAFYWGFILIQIPAGWIMGRYGPKWFLVGSILVGSTLGILMPAASIYLGSTALMVARAIQGFCHGFILPAMACFGSRWIPTNERGRAMGIVLSAFFLGDVLAESTAGLICASKYGWPMAFYFFNGLGILWCIFYSIFGNNSPNEHPSITEAEKKYIQSSSVDPTKKLLPTPWSKIFTSIPFLNVLYCYACITLSYGILSSQTPTYFRKIMQIDIKWNGLLSALPPLLCWVMNIPFGIIADYVINKNIISLTNCRKIFTAIGTMGPALSMVFMAQCNKDDSIKAVLILIISMGLKSAHVSGVALSTVDLAPNYAGILQGIKNGFSHIFSVVGPLLVQLIVVDEYDPEQWSKIFYLISGMCLSGGIAFCIFGSGEVQSWNDSGNENEKDAEKIMETSTKA